ncbi:MAG: aminotransferase class I/II-fold pyridoxal phosphate-dependent enzyme [Candidatus Handelsmanbacteria bacterium]|nr:aminotransferase class I/II-fold pyridoxal phosphate-dependent enzyme [Candidatus Handelsmanbacteria bacterium]
MDPVLPFTPLIRSLPAVVPFVPPEALERRNGRPLAVRVGANESAFGISPLAREAMRGAVEQISWYNDPEAHELRLTLAPLHGVAMEEVCVAAGIDELLGLMVRLSVEPGDPVVSSRGSYPTFNFHVAGFGGRLCPVPYRGDYTDLEALAAEVKKTGAPLVYLANPDNPMGTFHPAASVRDFLGQLPPDCLVILDEAYVEFAPAQVHLPVETLDPRLVRMRTFSKAHGMAGARIGYAVAHRQVVAALDKIRNHFAVNRVAQAGALASLGDPGFLAGVVRQVEEGRREYAALAGELGLRAVPSGTNFVALEIGPQARRLLEVLLENDVFVRMPGMAPLDRCIRVTVGTPQERRDFAQVLRRVLPQVRP